MPRPRATVPESAGRGRRAQPSVDGCRHGPVCVDAGQARPDGTLRRQRRGPHSELSGRGGNSRPFVYGANGKLASVRDAGGGVPFYDYTGPLLTQIRTATLEGGVEAIQTRARYSHDTLGRLSAAAVDLSPQDNSIADGKVFQTFYAYDGGSDRIASVSQSDGTRLSFQYTQIGAAHRVSHVTDALGRVTRYCYDLGRRVTTILDPEHVTTCVSHDALGAILAVRVQGQGSLPVVTTRYAYTSRGELARIEESDGRVIEFAYDEEGNRVRTEAGAR